MLSKACQYGLMGMLYLAQQPPTRFFKVKEIAEAIGVSPSYLAKVFQALTEAGITRSYRGPSGGVQLKRTPEEITVLDIILAVDGDGLFTECVLGLPGCGDLRPCPIHDPWSEEREHLKRLFGRFTLAQLVEKPEQFRISLNDRD